MSAFGSYGGSQIALTTAAEVSVYVIRELEQGRWADGSSPGYPTGTRRRDRSGHHQRHADHPVARQRRIHGHARNGGQALVVVRSERVYGRKPLIRLVRDLMAREEVNGSLRNQRLPILVVEGFRGAGKTALLSTLVELLDQRVPYARLDFEVSRHASVPQVLSALAFELSRKCGRYGVLQFPRLIVGQLVMRLELDLTNHAQACQQVVAALERERGVDTFRDVLVETAGNVLTTMGRGSGLPVEPPSRYVLGLTLKWLTARAPGRLVLGPFQDWYGHRDLGLTNDSVDVLVDLNRWARDSEDEDDQQRVDDLLWAAFLADLRTEFDRGRRADERSLNCVVLLDNADTALGRRFLDQLVRARRQRVAGGQDDAEIR